MKTLRPFKVFAIKNGTVIDHIPAGKGLLLIKTLKLPREKKIVTIGLNLKSKKLGLKDLVKIEDRELTQEEVNQVALFAPAATINIIRNFEVAKKMKVRIPAIIVNLLKCPNPKCITENEQVITKFYPLAQGFCCHYCERIFSEEEIINKFE